MLMPEIHACAAWITENEKLKKCIRKQRRENKELLERVREYEEQSRLQTLLHDLVTTRDSQTQTEPMKVTPSHTFVPPVKKTEQNIQSEKLSKMMMMHTSLMKRYEKELKTNMQQVETITALNLKIHELEQKLHASAIEIADLRSEKVEQKPKETKSAHSDDGNLREELCKVKKERDRLAADKQRLKKELKGLDHGFFEEVEDIKYALGQSVLLNREYDSCLRKLCAKFDIPHPHPERKLQKDHHH